MSDSILKHKVDQSIFDNFSMPRITDGWTECSTISIHRYKTSSVPINTYFDESIVIDDYSNIVKNKEESDDTNSSEIVDNQDPKEDGEPIDSTIITIDTSEELYDAFSLKEDIHVSFSGSTIPLTEQFVIDDGQTIEIDLNGNISSEGNVGGNGRLFQINNGKLVINGNGNTLTSSSDSYGLFRVEENGVLELNNVILENSKGWGLNIKVLGGSATLNNVTINSIIGGGIEVTEKELGTNSKPGIAIVNNCNFTQSQFKDHCSTCLSVSGGSNLIVNSGTFISENYCLYVFSSGGTIEVNGGTFRGTNKECIKAAIDTNTYPSYIGGFKIHSGSFSGTADIISPAFMNIDGGSFTFDPSEYIDSNTSKIDYDSNSGYYTVSKK